MKPLWAIVLFLSLLFAQEHDHLNKPGMQMNEAGMYLMNMASGTSRNPQSWPMPMLMPRLGSWNLMLMGQAYLVDTQQSGPRGGDKSYSANWFMAAAERKAGRGSFLIQAMLSLDPATVTNRSYPLLFRPARPHTESIWWTHNTRTIS